MSLFGALAEHHDQRQGKEVFVDEVTFDSSGQATVSPGLATIDAVLATIKSNSAPTAHMITWSESDGTITLHAWEPTASGDTGLTASDAGETASIVVIGRVRGL